jgi:hypothetical protein
MRLYKVKWFVNDELSREVEEAFWADSELIERYDEQLRGVENIIRYEYEYIRDIKLPDDLFDFSNAKF